MESGLIYFGNRYYDPSLGCWISPDPIGYNDGPNLYAYVSNNPLTHYDAFGLFEEERDQKGIAQEREESMALAREDTLDVFDNPRDYFGNSFSEWQDSSVSATCQDFYEGLKSGVSDPTNPFIDVGRPEFIHKSHGTIAGEVIGVGVGALAGEAVSLAFNSIVKGINYWRGASNSRITKNIVQITKIANANEKALQLNATKNVALEIKHLKPVTNPLDKWKFPSNPADLLKELPRDRKGHIYVSDRMRIRPEKHALEPLEKYCPRHHGQHYHVEYTSHLKCRWTKKNTHKFKPNNYKLGDGTGFLPGEFFPGVE